MKPRIFLIVLFLSIAVIKGFSQEKNRKELKQERKLEKQKQTEAMIDARQFVFIARTALPSEMGSMDLTTNPNYIKFQPDLIDSYMPFFGRAYSGVGYGIDRGLKFKGKPDIFKVEKKAETYQIDVVVKDESDTFSLYLTVSTEGTASLSITCNNRSSISYFGAISAFEKPSDK